MVKRYLKENAYLTGSTPTGVPMEFRFDGADICLMAWDELVDEDGKAIHADEGGYYTECFGDEDGGCAGCPDANSCLGRRKR